MNPTDRPQFDPKNKIDNSLTVSQTGEKKIFTVKKHPIGLFGAYALSGALTIAAAVLAFVAAPDSSSASGNASSVALATIIFLIVAVVSMGFSFLVTKIYMGNSWTLTSDSVTQVVQNNLFDRESSQLSLHNLEDISSEQNGFFPHIFNYGLIKVETAGEKSKFTFNYCPNPNYYASQILAAREAFLLSHREAIAQDLTGSKYNTLNMQPKAPVETLTTNPSPAPSTAQPNFLDPETVPPPPNYQPPS